MLRAAEVRPQVAYRPINRLKGPDRQGALESAASETTSKDDKACKPRRLKRS